MDYVVLHILGAFDDQMLDNVVPELAETETYCFGQNFFNNWLILWLRIDFDHLLNHSATIRIHDELVSFLDDCLEDKRDFVVFDGFEAFLDHVIRVVVHDVSENVFAQLV